MTHHNGTLAAVRLVTGSPLVEEPLEPASLRCFTLTVEASYREVDKMDRRLGILLPRWGFANDHWCNEVRNAVVELLSNLVEFGGPRRATTPHRLHLFFMSMAGQEHRYLWAIVDSGIRRAIDVRKLRPENTDLLGERGRGSHIVAECTDAFFVLRDVNGFLIRRRLPLVQ